MAIPDYQALMLPMLEVLADGDMRRVVPGVSDVLATRFHLTDDELQQMLPSGAMPTFINRTHWAATYMSKAGLVERPKRGHVCITQRGRDLLATEPDRIDLAVLARYPEYEAWKKRSSTKDSGATSDQNPEESLYSAYGSWRKTVEADLLDRLASASFPWQSFEVLVVDPSTRWATGAATKTANV